MDRHNYQLQLLTMVHPVQEYTLKLGFLNVRMISQLDWLPHLCSSIPWLVGVASSRAGRGGRGRLGEVRRGEGAWFILAKSSRSTCSLCSQVSSETSTVSPRPSLREREEGLSSGGRQVLEFGYPSPKVRCATCHSIPSQNSLIPRPLLVTRGLGMRQDQLLYSPPLCLLHGMVDTVGARLQGSEGPDGREFPLAPCGLKHLVLVQLLCITAILCPVNIIVIIDYVFVSEVPYFWVRGGSTCAHAACSLPLGGHLSLDEGQALQQEALHLCPLIQEPPGETLDVVQLSSLKEGGKNAMTITSCCYLCTIYPIGQFK